MLELVNPSQHVSRCKSEEGKCDKDKPRSSNKEIHSLWDSQRTRNLEIHFGIPCAEEIHPFEQTWSWSSCCPTEDDIDVGDDQGTWYFMQRPTQTAIPWQNEEDWNVDPPLEVPAESIWPCQRKEYKSAYTALVVKACLLGGNRNTKCSITFVNIAVVISALAGGGGPKTVSHRDDNFCTESRSWLCFRDCSTSFGCLSFRTHGN